MAAIRGVLFDLDGTLLDTAPDLAFALNRVRALHDLPEFPIALMRQIANLGSKKMIKIAFGMEEDDNNFKNLREQFLLFYQEHLADQTAFFPNVEKVLSHLEEQNIPWGIVTNKLTCHGEALLRALKIDQRTQCVVFGDTLPTSKPDPAPIIHACQLLKLRTEDCIFVGDALTDITASKAAGTKSLAALYGYIHDNEDPYSWQADGYIKDPLEIIGWLNK